MDYKNLLIRAIVSSFFVIYYLTLGLSNKYYLLIIILILYLIALYEIWKKFKNIFFINIYVLISLTFFLVYFFYLFDYLFFNLFFITIISFDIFSYLFGSLIGKKKLFPHISPGKTLEGLIFGIISANIISILYIFNFGIFTTKIFLLINILIFSSFIGDLIESYFKRISNLKNSSNFLPGHGGIFDRIDSYILSIYVLFVFSLIK
tara:strand:+ start:156 stop:773 length:618 start_codon:yes stop_codon:yes gene_type:complete